MTRRNFDARALAEAVEATPDYQEAAAEKARLAALKEKTDAAYNAAATRVDEIWEREATRLFGPPPSAGSTPR
ncbi:hypothetical protein [Mycolicibacterium neoaurum]|uniref:hypothetical protein n=1 Tax=Mycolicibacterium neoaurum TaxID=1795 RepID=UPI001F4CB30B|nr:hypothetical protein [Mycolicibacterium neoaurum]